MLEIKCPMCTNSDVFFYDKDAFGKHVFQLHTKMEITLVLSDLLDKITRAVESLTLASHQHNQVVSKALISMLDNWRK